MICPRRQRKTRNYNMGTITTALSDQFKLQLLKGNHDFDNSMRVILLKEEENLVNSYDATTADISTVGADEVSDTNYNATYSLNAGNNGAEATVASGFPQIATGTTTAVMDFNDVTFSNVTVASDGCILYNHNNVGNEVIAVFSFGGTVSSTSGDFTIQFPAPGATTSILRIA